MILRSNANPFCKVFNIEAEYQCVLTDIECPNSGSWDTDHTWSDCFTWDTHSIQFNGV